jgi:hypothetical protein
MDGQIHRIRHERPTFRLRLQLAMISRGRAASQISVVVGMVISTMLNTD